MSPAPRPGGCIRVTISMTPEERAEIDAGGGRPSDTIGGSQGEDEEG